MGRTRRFELLLAVGALAAWPAGAPAAGAPGGLPGAPGGATGADGEDSAPPADGDSEGPQPIVGGNETEDWPTTVAIMQDLGGGQAALFCSGTLIREDVVITAAHCMDGNRPDFVFFGTSPFDGSGGVSILVDDWMVHSGWDGTFSETEDLDDLGLLFLAETAPVPPIFERTASVEALLGLELTYAGYGETQGTGVDGVRREATSVVDSFISDAVITQPADGSPCFGDSGGSLYFVGPNSFELAGITSFVENPACLSGYAGAIRTDLHTAWITNHAGPVPGGDDDDDDIAGDDDDDDDDDVEDDDDDVADDDDDDDSNVGDDDDDVVLGDDDDDASIGDGDGTSSLSDLLNDDDKNGCQSELAAAPLASRAWLGWLLLVGLTAAPLLRRTR